MSLEQAEDMREEVLQTLRQSPYEHNIERSRWRLKDLVKVVQGRLRVSSTSGMWHILRRLGIKYRRSWEYNTSPDPLAATKLAWIEVICQRAQQIPDKVVVAWMDELTIYHSPSVAPTWSNSQQRGRKAYQATAEEITHRILGILNHHTGQVHYWTDNKIGKLALQQFYSDVRHCYPDAEEIYVIQDCWPVHFLPEVCQAAVQADIAMVSLPTYSSWRNPIEQLWRWLKQDVLHMHPWLNSWDMLQQAVRRFLDQFSQPNTELLHYVGLSG